MDQAKSGLAQQNCSATSGSPSSSLHFSRLSGIVDVMNIVLRSRCPSFSTGIARLSLGTRQLGGTGLRRAFATDSSLSRTSALHSRAGMMKTTTLSLVLSHSGIAQPMRANSAQRPLHANVAPLAHAQSVHQQIIRARRVRNVQEATTRIWACRLSLRQSQTPGGSHTRWSCPTADEHAARAVFCAAAERQGGAQEDRFVCKAGLDQEAELRGLMLPPLAFFAVFDGHGGEGTANFLERMLHCSFVEELQKLKRSRVRVCIAPALAQAFRATERRIVNGILRCARAGGEEDSDDDPETPCPDGADEADAGGRAGAWGGSPPPLVLSGHAASLTPY